MCLFVKEGSEIQVAEEYLKTRDTDTLKNFIEIIFGDNLVKDVVANAVSSLYGIIVE